MLLKTKLSTTDVLLIIILLLAAILRFYKFDTFSLSNDELSALFRTKFDNLSDVFNQGVKLDFHPAGVQLFLYYWVRIFGDSETSLRLPFVIAGILSVWLLYHIATNWFNEMTGLFASGSIAFLQFPLLYSHIARPYSSGLFLTLLAVYFWTLLLFRSENKPVLRKTFYAFGFGISTAACMYNHYFSFLFIAIVGLTGLFFIKRHNWIYYLSAGIFALLLFIPHLGITQYHFSIGGLSSWLGKPGGDWFVNHIRFIFNQSNLLFMIFVIIFLISLIVSQRSLKFSKFHYFCIIWFLLPYLIAFYYSIFINPVIQNSILIFSFPYLLLFLFSYLKERITTSKIIMLIAFLGIGTFNTVSVYGFYQRQHFSEFKDIAKTIIEWDTKYGNQQITKAINVNAPFYINYYLERYSSSPVAFVQYENRGGKDLFKLKELVKKSQNPYFLYTWTKPAPNEIPEIIKTCYPYLIHQKNYDGLSEISLYSKIDSSDQIKRNSLKTIKYDFESSGLTNQEKGISDSIIVWKGKFSCKLDSQHEYSPTYSDFIASIVNSDVEEIKISIWSFVPEINDAQIVFSIDNEEENIFWSSMKLSNFNEAGQWGQAFFNIKLPECDPEKDRIHIYVWNADKHYIFIDDMIIRFYGKE